MTFLQFGLTALALTLSCSRLPAGAIPGTSTVEARLMTQLGSRISKKGDPVGAVIIAPTSLDGTVLTLQGSTLSGTVLDVHSIGLGLKRQAADLQVRFDSIRLPNGHVWPLVGRIHQIETAREHVESTGRVTGIDPAASISAGLSFALSTTLMHTGMMIPSVIIRFVTARSPDSEINLPIGTELLIDLQTPETLANEGSSNDRCLESIPASGLLAVQTALHSLTSQRVSSLSHRRSDLLNVALIGTKEQVKEAFNAAGWKGEDRHSLFALYRVFACLIERHGFGTAPMSVLTLDGKPATMTFQKGLDTITKRHHVRLWQQEGSNIWFGAATEDIGLTVSRMRITHATAPNIDNERAKVVNDLAAAGCLEEASLLQRPDVGSLFGKTEHLTSDQDLAVARLGDCNPPSSSPLSAPLSNEAKSFRSKLGKVSQAMLLDALRSNPGTMAMVAVRGVRTILGRNGESSFKSDEPFTRTSVIDSCKPVRLALAAEP